MAVSEIRRSPRDTRRRSRSTHQVPEADHPPTGRVREVPVRTTEKCLDAAHQLAQAERLGQVIVRTQLQADHLVDLIVPGRQEEDGRLGARRPQAAQDLEPIHPRQSHVQDDQIGRLLRGELQALLATPRDPDVVPLLLERVLDSPSDRELVLDDEDRGVHGRELYIRDGLLPSRGRGARERAMPDALVGAGSVESPGPPPPH